MLQKKGCCDIIKIETKVLHGTVYAGARSDFAIKAVIQNVRY